MRGAAQKPRRWRKAESYKQYGDAAVLDLLVKMLPDLVREAAAPLSAVDQMTVISTEGAGDLTRTTASTVAQGLQLVRDVTGLDLPTLLASRVGADASDASGADHPVGE